MISTVTCHYCQSFCLKNVNESLNSLEMFLYVYLHELIYMLVLAQIENNQENGCDLNFRCHFCGYYLYTHTFIYAAKEKRDGFICVWRGWSGRSTNSSYSRRPELPFYDVMIIGNILRLFFGIGWFRLTSYVHILYQVLGGEGWLRWL